MNKKCILILLVLFVLVGCNEIEITEEEIVNRCLLKSEMIYNKINRLIVRINKIKTESIIKKRAIQNVIQILRSKNTIIFSRIEINKYIGNNDHPHTINMRLNKWYPCDTYWYGGDNYYSWKEKQKDIIISSLRELVLLKSYSKSSSNYKGHASSLLLLGNARWSGNSNSNSIEGIKVLSKYIEHDLFVLSVIAEIMVF